jgi:hypothetical protein
MTFQFAIINASWLFALACAILAWVLLRRYVRLSQRGARRGRDAYMEHLHRPDGPWDGAQHDAAALIERKQVELYDLARDAAGRIDSKLILLERLLDQGQQQIERMEELLGELQAVEHSHS